MADTLLLLDHRPDLYSVVGGITDTSTACSFDLVGITEENGKGLSKGLRSQDSPPHAYVNGKRIYTRLFVIVDALNCPSLKDEKIFKRLMIRRINE